MEKDKEYNFRQVIAAKALYFAINGNEEKSEALRFFLRKLSETEKKEMVFPQSQTTEFKKAA